MTTRLFVYGSLMPDADAWEVLARWTTGTPQADAAPGRLYDTGRGYPAARFDTADETLVHGVVVELSPEHASTALATLDRYEAEEYDRITVRTRRGVDVFTYDWTAQLSGCKLIPSGRWPTLRP